MVDCTNISVVVAAVAAVVILPWLSYYGHINLFHPRHGTQDDQHQ